MRYLIGTRGSKLALVQTDYVIDKLKKAYPDDDFEAVIIKTTGDIEQKKALDKIGSKGIFVKEIEDELLSGKIHMAVHSMKDMPDEPAAGLTFAKAWKREDPRDALVLKNVASLDELPKGAVIGTGSKRRKYQLLKLRPDLKVVGIRGNIDTRLRKLYDGDVIYEDVTNSTANNDLNYNCATNSIVNNNEIAGEKQNKYTEYKLDGIVLAAAGIKRIGRESEITQYFSEDEMIPAPAQGTLALELRADNVELMRKLDALSDEETDLCANVERDFLKQIGGNCHLPVAAYCDIVSEKDSCNDISKNSRLRLLAMFGTEDGKSLARTEQVVEIALEKNKSGSAIDIVEQAVQDIRYKLEIK